MKANLRYGLLWILMIVGAIASCVLPLAAEPVPLKRVVELALVHATATGAATADEQRAFASYREARNQYVPQFIIGSGLGKSWGFPPTLEGSAPSIVNVNAQSALFNPALREFVRAAKIDWQASSLQNKDQRSQVIQDTVMAYVELNKWESLLAHLQQEQTDAAKVEDIVGQRVKEGIDSPVMQSQARLGSARVRMRLAEASGSIDVLRSKLAQLTGLKADSIGTSAESIPALPEIPEDENLVAKATQSNPAVQAAENRATALDFRAKGEHRSLWPTIDFAAQYAVLARYNNYDQFFNANSFQRNNATIGVAMRFPFFSASQHAHAQAADAEAIRGHKDAETAKNKVSEETLRLQRAVRQLAAAQEVASLEYEVAQANLQAMQVKAEAGSTTLRDIGDARNQANERFHSLQDANFELERARIALLRATGDLDNWAGVAK
jgi:outer membrane protein